THQPHRHPGSSPSTRPRTIKSSSNVGSLRAHLQNCHPDRSMSFPEGRACGVEGPAASIQASRVPHFSRVLCARSGSLLFQRLLLSVAAGSDMWKRDSVALTDLVEIGVVNIHAPDLRVAEPGAFY